MKNLTPTEKHEAALRAVTARMISEGYRIVVEPRGTELPDFLAGLRPDLIAHRDAPEEHLVVEVRLRGAPKKDWSTMIARVKEQPHWAFRLEIADDDTAELDFAPPDASTIRNRLAEPEQLLQEGHPVASLLVAWSLFEAAARLRMDLSNEGPPRGLHPEGVLQRLVYLGHLANEDFERLRGASTAYHRAAHGDLGVLVDNERLQALRRATEALLPSSLAA